MAPVIKIEERYLKILNLFRFPYEDISHLVKVEKPKIKLHSLADHVKVVTRTEKEFNELMRCYMIGGWLVGKGRGEERYPTTLYGASTQYAGKACVGAHNHFYVWSSDDLRELTCFITPERFYEIQKIKPETIKEINRYFDVEEHR